MKINGEMRYLWRAADHQGEVLKFFVTKTRDKTAALRFINKTMKRHGRPGAIVTDGLRSYDAALGWLKPPISRSRAVAEQPGREFPPSLPATRAGDAAVSDDENPAGVRVRPRPSPQSFSTAASLHQLRPLQRTTLRRLGRVEDRRGISPARD